MHSRCETIVARLANTGLRSEEFAIRLDRRVGTIKNQLRSVYRKLGVRNRVELARQLIEFSQEGTGAATPPR
jgi:DNA-binding CsgD family transcriptional regulator